VVLPNTSTDVNPGTILANLVTDALRAATGSDIGWLMPAIPS